MNGSRGNLMFVRRLLGEIKNYLYSLIPVFCLQERPWYQASRRRHYSLTNTTTPAPLSFREITETSSCQHNQCSSSITPAPLSVKEIEVFG